MEAPEVAVCMLTETDPVNVPPVGVIVGVATVTIDIDAVTVKS
jgi:hypothetical protein